MVNCHIFGLSGVLCLDVCDTLQQCNGLYLNATLLLGITRCHSYFIWLSRTELVPIKFQTCLSCQNFKWNN